MHFKLYFSFIIKLNFRPISDRFDVSKSTLSYMFFRIVDILCDISDTIIRWPTADERRVSKKKFGKKSKLTNIIRAIDGTYVPIKAPKDQVRSYTPIENVLRR